MNPGRSRRFGKATTATPGRSLCPCRDGGPWSRTLAAVTGVVLALGLSANGVAPAAERPTGPKPPETPEMVENGEVIYFRRCSFCHGLLGDGNGPAAQYMDPRPRDFTLGTFKFRTTESGELPTDEDLFRTVSRGLAGTGMQPFDNDLIRNGLTEMERWAVIYYIKTFAPEFENPEFDPYERIVEVPADRVPYNDQTIARGEAVFERAKCWECHGKLGRGDGQKAFDRKDDWGFPIRIRNVTHPWKIKAGIEVEDIFMRFSTGINGTPMPSFVKTLSEQERWYLANYIKSLQHQPTEHEVLNVRRLEGELPDGPDDPAWAGAEPMDMRLAGQVVVAPRWQNPSIELVTVRALYNDRDIAFLIEWDDAFQDLVHQQDLELDTTEIVKVGAFNSYVEANGMVPRRLETFRDALAFQFPIKLPEGTKKPHFLRGGASNPIHLWVWKADLDAAGKPSVEEAVARGWKQPVKAQAADQQQVTAKAVWREGRWRVAMKRPLTTADRNDVQFVPGRFIPVAVNAWDGSNGEHGLIMSLSSWYYVFLEAPTPMTVYVYTVLAVLLAGALGYWLMRRAEKEATREGVT
ncbi:MAG: ethylbenzene dehydrogenase-related protein [Kiloniellales bacterium]